MNKEYLLLNANLEALPRAFPNAPRVFAKIKERIADFVVEEVPAYLPCGEGQHIYLWVEKRDCSGGDLIRRLAAVLGIDPGDVGYAGTKDRRAIARQWISVPERCERTLQAITELEGIRILAKTRHKNKLRLGHLRGNRFWILLRGADPNLARPLAETASILEKTGFPNFYGVQRFGEKGESILLGIEIIQTGSMDAPAFRRLGRFERRMALSSVQSALFNLVLRERMLQGTARKVLKGDILRKTETGGLFESEDTALDQARLEAGEVEITGPIFGYKTLLASGDAGKVEQEVLRVAEVHLSAFRPFSSLARGTRRPFFVKPEGLRVEPAAEGIMLTFFLPKGAYASAMLREFVVQPGSCDETKEDL